MSKLGKMMAMTAIMASASMPYGARECEMAKIGRPAPKRYRGESPKCKSCAYFGCCYKCQEPMKMACDEYKRRKRKK